MTTPTSTKGGGLELVSAGMLWIISSLIHPSDFDSQALFSPFWVPNAILILIAYLLIPFGLFAIQRCQVEKVEKWSRIGLVLTIIGSIASAVTSYVFGFIAPTVAALQAQPISLFNLIKPGGQLMWAGLLLSTYVLFFLPGCILMGIAIVRAAVLPPGAGWLLIAGVVTFSMGRIIAKLFILTALGGVLFGIALIWLGYALFSSTKMSLESKHGF